MKIDVDAFVRSLGFMGEGLLGIFLVMGVIMAAVYALNRLTAKEEEKP